MYNRSERSVAVGMWPNVSKCLNGMMALLAGMQICMIGKVI